MILGCLYEALYHQPFAPDSAGTALGSSLTVAELRQALSEIRDAVQLDSLRRSFQESRANIMRLATREGVELVIPEMLPETGADRLESDSVSRSTAYGNSCYLTFLLREILIFNLQ